MAEIYEVNQKKLLFINPPKCGTNSIEEVCNKQFSKLSKRQDEEGNITTTYGHAMIKDIKESYDISFCSIRNPWDRMVSWYHYLSQTDSSQHGERKWKGIALKLNFEQFVYEWTSSDISHSTFQPQFNYIVDKDNSVIVDYLVCCDNLEETLNNMMTKIGADNNLSVGRVRPSKHRDFKTFYQDNNKLIECVRNWEKDILKHYKFNFTY